MASKSVVAGVACVETAVRSALWAVVLAAGSVASAQDMIPSAAVLNPQHRDENGEVLKRSNAPVSGVLTYNSDANANVAGGISRGAAYLQRIGLIGDADLDRLIGWRGASAHVSVQFINGTGLSGARVGNLLTVSGLEAEPAARLFNLWVEQRLDQGTTLRVGQFTAGQEFAVSSTAALFVNSTFGWPASFATDLPSGGPAYPLAAPGLRVAATRRDGLTLRVAVFAGDPAGPGFADPQRRDRHGFNGFRFAGKPFFIGDVSRSAPGDDPAWVMTLGGWAHSGDFNDLALNDRAAPLAGGSSTGTPLQHQGNWSVYGMADGRLWRAGPRTLRGFLRMTASPANRNPIDLYLDGGLTLSAPLRGRADDVVGIGFAIGRISPRLQSGAEARAQLPGAPTPIAGYEAVVEASWQVKCGARAYLQPNAQLILHPSAGLLAGAPAANNPSHAIVVGLRASFRL